MYTVRFLLGIVCLVNACGHRMPDSNLLIDTAIKKPLVIVGPRQRLISIAKSQLGVQENGRNNHGPEVESYQAYTKVPAGSPWCAAFLSWVYGEAGYRQPRTAWSPALFPSNRKTFDPKPADLVGFYYPDLGRIAHCGMLEARNGNWLLTIEGNTSIAGSRDGDGIQRKRRHIKSITKFADWVNKKGAKDE